MAQPGTLRLSTFRPARVGFDGLLRDTLVPELLAFPQLVDLHVGRQGPDETGARLVASKNPHYWDATHTRLNQIIFFPI